ncbi:hypothetical protein R1sor_007991 [Riccia sorocarpa]|uniref:Photosystem II 10 kDa polypeptide, chloroplastic n=1 Tax=Riccia sorocarpa TaxID=122646 RepID=A0ABD3HW59_9MARC
MASIVAVAGASAVVGLGTSTLSGKKLKVSFRPPCLRPRFLQVRLHLSSRNSRAVLGDFSNRVGIVAKYDSTNSKYFDLGDLGNTTGAWDLYGQDSRSPYNGLQATLLYSGSRSMLCPSALGQNGSFLLDCREACVAPLGDAGVSSSLLQPPMVSMLGLVGLRLMPAVVGCLHVMLVDIVEGHSHA